MLCTANQASSLHLLQADVQWLAAHRNPLLSQSAIICRLALMTVSVMPDVEVHSVRIAAALRSAYDIDSSQCLRNARA